MDQIIFSKYFLEPSAYQMDLHQCIKIIWLDNYSNHAMILRLAVVLVTKNIDFKILPPCSTHFCQPGDSFFILKIKDV